MSRRGTQAQRAAQMTTLRTAKAVKAMPALAFSLENFAAGLENMARVASETMQMLTKRLVAAREQLAHPTDTEEKP